MMRVIGMAEMELVFAETDRVGLHREAVKVELLRADPGHSTVAAGRLELSLPLSGDLALWLAAEATRWPEIEGFAALRRTSAL